MSNRVHKRISMHEITHSSTPMFSVTVSSHIRKFQGCSFPFSLEWKCTSWLQPQGLQRPSRCQWKPLACWTSACLIHYTQRQVPGSGFPCASCHQCGLARQGLWSATASHPTQTEANLISDVRQPWPSSHLIIVKTCQPVTSPRELPSSGLGLCSPQPWHSVGSRWMLNGRQWDHRPLGLTRGKQRPEQEPTRYSMVHGGTFV